MYCINVWLTVKDPADIESVRNHLAQACRLSRAEPGCQRFEVYHSEAEPTKFLLCERWDSKEALDVHRTAQAFTTIYQPQVLPKVDRQPHVCTLVE
jgi:quinol monooxygenase YgiN